MRSRNLLIDNSLGKIYSNINSTGNLTIALTKNSSIINQSTSSISTATYLGYKSYYFSRKSIIKDIVLSFNVTYSTGIPPKNASITVKLRKTSNLDSLYANSIVFYSAIAEFSSTNTANTISIVPPQKLIMFPGDFLFLDTVVLKGTSGSVGKDNRIVINYYG